MMNFDFWYPKFNLRDQKKLTLSDALISLITRMTHTHMTHTHMTRTHMTHTHMTHTHINKTCDSDTFQ